MSRRWLVIALAAAVLASLANSLWLAETSWGVDFFQFRAVAQVAWHPETRADPFDAYSPEARRQLGARFVEVAARAEASDRERHAARFRGTFETYSTPFLYTLFGLFSRGDYDGDLRLYHVVSLLAFAIGVSLLCWHLGIGRVESLLALLVFATWFEPFASELRVANVNSLQLAILVAFLVVGRRWPSTRGQLAAGAILGFGTMLKPNLAFAVALLGFSRLVNGRARRAWAELAGFAVAALAAFGLASWRFGSAASWLDWLRALRRLPDRIITVDHGNYALGRLLQDWSQQDTTIHLTVVAVAFAAFAIWQGRTQADPDPGAGAAGAEDRDDTAVVAVGCLIMLLTSRLAWLHYFVMAIPMILVLAASRPAGSRALPRLAALAATLAISVTPWKVLGLVTAATPAALVVNAGTLLLFGFGLRELASAGGAREPRPGPL